MSTSVTHLCIPIHEGRKQLHVPCIYIIHDAMHKYNRNSHTHQEIYPYADANVMWTVDGIHQSSAQSLFVPPWHQGLYHSVKSVSIACNQEVTACFMSLSAAKQFPLWHLRGPKRWQLLSPILPNQPLTGHGNKAGRFRTSLPRSHLTQNDFHCAELPSDVQ